MNIRKIIETNKRKRILRTKVFIILLAMMILPFAVNVNASAAAKPEKPALVKISSPAYNKITLTWKKVSNATNYVVYYKQEGAAKWTRLATVSSSNTSYTHTSSSKYPIVVGQKYSYTVRAYNKATKKYGLYDKKGLTVATKPKPTTSPTAKPKKPALVKISSSAYNKITVTWKKVSNATNYVVYYKQEGAAKWTRLTTVSSSNTSYTHISSSKYPIVVGQRYSYTVRAYNKTTKKYGSYDKKGLAINTVPNTVKPGKISMDDDLNVTITWKKAGGADKYVIYRASLKSMKLTKIATVNSNVLSYTDKNCITGTTNYYTIKAYSKKKKVYGNAKTNALSIKVPSLDGDDNDDKWIPTPEFTEEELAMQVIELTNKERIKYGEEPLTYNAALQKAAMVRAKDISVYFSHARPDGSNASYTYRELGVITSGENIASGHQNAESVVQAWMNSSGHRAAMLGDYKYIGVGVYRTPTGGYYWVQAFASSNPEEKYTTIFDANGGTFSDTSKTYTYSTDCCATGIFRDESTFAITGVGRIYMKDMPVPTKEGYTFNGWINEDEERFNSCGINGETFHAEWIPNE